MDDFGYSITYTYWTDSGFGRVVQACGTRAAYGFCNYDEQHWLQVSWRQVI